MSSSILYKFRSGTNFEALPLPGTAARLFDVKRAIVKAKKLDVSSGNSQLEFDLKVQNATTQEEYADESMLLPRGTRVIVQRLPAARGHGFLARMAQADAGMAVSGPSRGAAAPSGFYTIESRDRDEEDEFVQSAPADASKEEKEMAALLAVTEGGAQASSGFRPTVSSSGYNRVAGAPPPPPRGGHGHFHKPNQRPNADPELRDQEQRQKKRATGIPRTFLNLSAPPVIDGSKGQDGEEAEAVARLQPNALGFKELVNRGGGQSESAAGTRRDLDYALKLTATTIPEHLQCGICHSVVKNAMLLPWDPEGRTACENCIRDALTQSGFRCPLTGIEGVSPDDLHPNYGLRKAAELFIKGVMEKMEEIEKQQVDEGEVENDEPGGSKAGTGFEGDSTERGVILSRKTRKEQALRKQDDDDPFGAGDDFGGDVFDVAADNDEQNDENVEDTEEATESEKVDSGAIATSDASPAQKPGISDSAEGGKEQTDGNSLPTTKEINTSNQSETKQNTGDTPVLDETNATTPSKKDDTESAAPRASPTTESGNTAPQNRRDARRRGPPTGYAMGPAGGSAVRGGDRYSERPEGDGGYGAPSQAGGRGPGRGFSGSPQPGGGGGGYPYRERPPYRGRGRGRGRFPTGEYESGGRGGRHHQSHYPSGRGDDRYQHSSVSQQDDDGRGMKRPRSESDDHGATDERYRAHGGPAERPMGVRHNDRPHGGGDPRYESRRGGPFRGGYGGRRGGRGGYRGRGGGYGRGRY